MKTLKIQGVSHFAVTIQSISQQSTSEYKPSKCFILKDKKEDAT